MSKWSKQETKEKAYGGDGASESKKKKWKE